MMGREHEVMMARLAGERLTIGGSWGWLCCGGDKGARVTLSNRSVRLCSGLALAVLVGMVGAAGGCGLDMGGAIATTSRSRSSGAGGCEEPSVVDTNRRSWTWGRIHRRRCGEFEVVVSSTDCQA